MIPLVVHWFFTLIQGFLQLILLTFNDRQSVVFDEINMKKRGIFVYLLYKGTYAKLKLYQLEVSH